MFIATLPIHRLPSDVSTFEKTTSVLTVQRGGVVIWQGSLRPLSVTLEGMVDASQVPSNQIIWSPPMSAQNVSITSVSVNNTSGVITIFYDDLSSDSFDNLDDMKAAAASMTNDNSFAKKVLIAKIIANSPDGANLTNQVGAQVSINPAADVPIVYTPPSA